MNNGKDPSEHEDAKHAESEQPWHQPESGSPVPDERDAERRSINEEREPFQE